MSEYYTPLALFCKGYLSAYSNAGCYHIHDKWTWKFGYWLGLRAFNTKESDDE